MYSDYGNYRSSDDVYADAYGTSSHRRSSRNVRRAYGDAAYDRYDGGDAYESQRDTYEDSAFAGPSSQSVYDDRRYRSSEAYREPHYYNSSRSREYQDSNYYEGARHPRYDYRRPDPSSPRRQTRTPSPPPPPIPTSPSREYLTLSKQPSEGIDPASQRKLLILDLNGTLLVRKDRRTPYPRPYMPAFRDFLFADATRRWLDVMIWSSAQPHNVEKMVRRCFFAGCVGKREDVEKDKWEGKLIAVWARDTLGLSSHDYSRKSQTTKDLAKPWSALPGSHSAQTTFLLDDSPAKARLQPYNHVCIREYDEAARVRDLNVKMCVLRDGVPQEGEIDVTDVAEDRPSSSQGASSPTPTAQEQEPVKGREQRRKEKKERKKREKAALLRPDSAPPPQDQSQMSSPTAQSMVGQPAKPKEEFDCTLLAVIGILDAMKTQGNIAGWISSGGLWAGNPPPATAASLVLTTTSENGQRAASPTDDEVADFGPEPGPPESQMYDSSQTPQPDPPNGQRPKTPTIQSASSTPPSSGERKRPRSMTAESESESAEKNGRKRHKSSPERPEDVADGTKIPEMMKLGKVKAVPAGNDSGALDVNSSTAPQLDSGDAAGVISTSSEGSRSSPVLTQDPPTQPPPTAVPTVDSSDDKPAEAPPLTPGMWFEDKKAFEHWVAQGRVVLRELGIDEQDGIDILS